MTIPPLHHVVLSVTDLERSIAFYTDVLGYRKTMEAPVEGEKYQRYLKLPPGTTGRMAMLQADERTMGMVEVIQWTPPLAEVTPPKRPGDPGVCMLAVEVQGQTLDEVVADLEAKGVPLWSEPCGVELDGYPPFHTILVEDPDGLLIELIRLPDADEVHEFRRAWRAQQAAAEVTT